MASTVSQIITELQKIAPEILNLTLSEQLSIRDQVDLDSIDYLRFLTSIHKKFNVEIPEKDYDKIQTLRELSDYIEHLKTTRH